MKDKERLLSEEEPLRFIFSHSALREGWDNPNVFQICTLNETRSAMKKRQEIGRGLRLPVDQHGQRVFDESVNKLFVMANESYEDFARALQTEYEAGLRRHLRQGADHGHCQAHPRRRRRATAHRPAKCRGDQEGPCRSKDARHSMDASSQRSIPRDQTSRSTFRSRFKSWPLPSWTCWRRTRSNATSARRRTRESTGSKRKCCSARNSRRFGTGSSRRRPTASSSRPTSWSGGPSPQSRKWRRSRPQKSA